MNFTILRKTFFNRLVGGIGLLLLLLFSNVSVGQTAKWNLTSSFTPSVCSFTATVPTSGSAISSVSASPGATSGYSGTGFPTSSTAPTTSTAKSRTNYQSFSLSNNTGSSVTINNENITCYYGGTGATVSDDYAVFYSLDAFATTAVSLVTNVAVNANSTASSALTTSITVANGATVTIRVFHYYTDATTSTCGVASLSLGFTPLVPNAFSAVIGNTQNILSATANATTSNVLLAWNTSNTFGTPVPGTSYVSGNSISGGGTILYNGAAGSSFYTHTTLTNGTVYYYKLWSVSNSSGCDYSATGLTANATPALPTYTTAAAGDWNTGATWTGGVVPPAGATCIVNHAVTLGASLNNTGSITVSATGSLQMNSGSWVYGTSIVYAATGSSLIMNSGGLYGIGTGQAFWPTTSPPYNVTINSGSSAQTNVAVGAVAGTLTLNGQLDAVNAVTVNGTLQLNSGGYVSSNAPIYGAASTLVYNTTYNVGTEWTGNSTSAGSGVPKNVTIQNSATVTTPSGSVRGLAGNMNVSAGTLTLSNDLYVGGNWTIGSASSQINNSKAVFFNGASGTQVIAKTGAGTVYFDYLIINKAAGSVQLSSSPATAVILNSTSGDVLQLLNVGTLDLNGQSFTLNNSGGTISTNGARTISSTLTGATLNITNNKYVTGTGTISIASNVTTVLTGGMDFGSSKSTINGTLQINSGGYVNNNSPIYSATSTLLYNGVTNYGVGLEWTGNASTAASGIPQNVTLTTSSVAMPSSIRGMAGNLTINTGSTFALNGTIGADLNIAGNWINSGTFTPSSRLVTFNGSTAQTLTGTTTFDYLTINNSSTGLTLAAATTVNQTLNFTLGKITLGTNNLTVGSAGLISGGSSTSYAVTASTGRVLKQGVGSTAVNFPIGLNTTNYTPISLANTTGTSDLSVNVSSTISNAVGDASKIVNLQWSVTSSAATTATVIPTWVAANQAASFVTTGTGELGNYTTTYTTYPTTLNTTTTTTSNVVLQSGSNLIVVGNTSAVKCITANIPYTMDFETVTVPNIAGCTSIQNAGSGNNWVTTNNPGTGFTSKTLTYNYSSSNAANAWFYTNGLNLIGGTSYRLTYRYGCINATYPENLKVAYGTSAVNTAMTTTIDTHASLVNITPATATIDFTPATNGVYYLGFNSYSVVNMDVLYVDDINVVLTPSCSSLPASVSATTAITTTTATLNWAAATSAPASGYEYYYSTSATAPTAGTTVSGSVGAGVLTADITGLTAATTYYFWVRSNCDGTNKSAWTGSGTFVTACTTPSAQPTTLNLTSVVATSLSGSFTLASPVSSGYLVVRSTSATAPTPVNGTTYAAASTALGVGTYVVTGNTTTSASTTFTSSSLTANTQYYYYVFAYNSSCTGTPNYLTTSPLSANAITCPAAPTTFVNSSITTTGATIAWTGSAGGTAGTVNYTLEVYTGSGYTGAVTGSPFTIGSATSYVVTALSGGTTYYYRVKANNGACYSAYLSSGTFTTLCSAITSLPWTENFDSLTTTGAVPNCWLNQTGSYAWSSGNAASSSYNDPRSASYYMTVSYGNTTPAYLWTPGFVMTAGTSYDLSFYYVGDGYTGWIGDLVYNTSQTSSGATAVGSSFLTSATTSSTAYSLVKRSFIAPTSGTYYFAIKSTSNTTPWGVFGVDDFKLDLSPSPIAITPSPSATICSGSSATLTASSVAGYSYTWSPSTGLNTTSGAIVTASPTTTTIYTVTGVSGSMTNTQTITVVVNATPSAIGLTPTTASVCPSTIQSIVATGGVVTGKVLLTENFNGAITGWTQSNASTGGTTSSAAWGYAPDGYVYNSETFHSNDSSQFMITNSDAQGSSGTLTQTYWNAPVVNTVGYTSLSLSFYQYLKWDSNTIANVEVSTNNSTWTSVLTQNTATIGAAGTFALNTIDLTAYINKPTLYIRFNYKGSYSWYWGIDNFNLTGTYQSLTWSPTTALYTDAAATVPYVANANATIVYVKSATPGVTTYTATAANGSCTSTNTTSITIKTPVAITSATAASGANPICLSDTTTLTANGVAGTNAIVTWWTGTGGTGTNKGTGLTLVADPGTYYARVTGDCGTAVETSVTVGAKVTVAITSITVGANPICASATTLLTANGVVGTNAIVTWFTGSGATGTNLGTGLTLTAGPGTYYASVSGDCGTTTEANYTINAIAAPTWANLQWPPIGSICQGGTYVAYGQVYQAGVTDSAGQGNGITVEFGYNGTNTDPSTWTNWTTATYNTDNGNNDEYKFTFTPPTSGTYYYTFRYRPSTCAWQYGGYNAGGGNFWNGTTNVNGQLTVNANVTYYADTDSDGYGNSAATQVSCTGAPTGYVTNNTDCDDTNSAIYRSALLYTDADGDGYDAGSSTICYGANLPAGKSLTTSGTDCDDTNAAVTTNYSFYVDADNDTYGTGSLVSVCAVNAITPPTGYSVNATDCDDTTAAKWRSGSFYVDADADGYTVGATVSLCYGATTPTGYAATSLGTDCNDSNAAVNTNYSFYVDADHDTYGTGSLVSVCAANSSTPLSGYSVNNTDCDDTNAAKWRSGSFYVDADADHYTIGTAVSLCYGATVPTGYSATSFGTDCDDTRATTHPGAVDICGDGIDNDCNGTIDNIGLPGGCAPIVSTIIPAQCGTTLNLLDDLVYAALVSNAQGYRWRITKMNGSIPSTLPADIQMLDTGLRSFKFTQLASYAFDTTYQIEVAVRLNNTWQQYYGAACTVKTPATTTKVTTAQCGTTLTLMTDIVYANLVSYATGYRFKVTNVVTNYVQVIDRSVREFRFNLLTNIPYSTPFKVEVAVRNTNGTYLPYGTSCYVTTPLFPTTSLQNSQCDYTAASTTETIYANLVANATNYRFSITNSSIGYGYVFDTTLRSFALNTVPSLLPGTTYSVKVMVKIGGVWGAYGKICTLTTSGEHEEVHTFAKMLTMFDATAYPNPFASNFKLDIKTSNEATIQVKVYDLLGKLIENQILEPTQVEGLEVGANYPSGVYNVIVSQGEDVKTLRVIKR